MLLVYLKLLIKETKFMKIKGSMHLKYMSTYLMKLTLKERCH